MRTAPLQRMSSFTMGQRYASGSGRHHARSATEHRPRESPKVKQAVDELGGEGNLSSSARLVSRARFIVDDAPADLHFACHERRARKGTDSAPSRMSHGKSSAIGAAKRTDARRGSWRQESNCTRIRPESSGHVRVSVPARRCGGGEGLTVSLYGDGSVLFDAVRIARVPAFR